MELEVILKKVESLDGEPNVLKGFPIPSSIVVKEQLKQPISFTITYAEDICDGDFKMIQEDVLNPFSEIEIWVSINKEAYCLIKGIVQSHQIKLVHGGQGSQLQVTGVDNSIRLSWVTETKNWGKKIDAGEIVSILSSAQKTKTSEKVRIHRFSKYNIAGINYTVNEKGDPIMEEQNTALQEIEDKPANENKVNKPLIFKGQMQRSDDLAFIKQLAAKRGLYFWISYDEMGNEIVNFDKLPLIEYNRIDPSKINTLMINEEDNDIDEFSISWDVERPTSVKSETVNPRKKEESKGSLNNAPQPKLGNVTLNDMTGYVIEVFQSANPLDKSDMEKRDKAALDEAEWFIKASCSTTYDRLCKKGVKIIHAHTLINIVGAGSKHSGPYLVSGVTHTINEGSYKLDLDLMRNAWSDPDKNNENQEPAEE